MKSKLQWCCLVLLAACAGIASAQSQGTDPIQSLLFPPDVLIQHREKIGLTDEQVARIQSLAQELGPQTQGQQDRINKAMGRLAELLSAETVDEEAAMKQLEDVLSIEKEVKQLHLRLMIQIRNELNPQQRKVAAAISRNAQPAEGLEQRLQAKLKRVEDEVQRRASAGQPPFEVVGLMQKFPELMQGGQVQEAEALLDRVLAALGKDRADAGANKPQPTAAPSKLAAKMQRVQQRAEKMRQSGADVSKIRSLMDKVGALMQQGKAEEAEKLIDEALKLSDEPVAPENKSTEKKTPDKKTSQLPDAIRDQVVALKKEDVAWRHIEWKTCLLDGLQASREQNKPIMLWVFIDRPIDDERC